MDEIPQEQPKPTVERDEKGRLLPGSVLNPTGTGNEEPWQPYGKRCRYWLNRLTRGEIKRLAQNEPELDEMSSYDSMIIVHLARTQAGKAIQGERAQLLAYIEGMPVQTIHTTEVKKPTEKDIDMASDQEAQDEHDRLIKK